MSLVNFKEMLLDAKKNKYAVPCLVAGNLEMCLGQIKAAENKKSPIILAFPPHVISTISIEFIIPFITNVAKSVSVPVAVQLDHGFDFNQIMKSIHCGVSAVMFDGSSLTYEENVNKTKEFVKISHSLDVSVEAELGFVGGSISNETGVVSKMTDPEQVADFVSKTNVDALAVSFGNLHGKYTGEPELDIERLRKISSLTDIPLVMHGGSGLTDYDYKNVVKNGISDVHFYSYIASNIWPYWKNKISTINRNPIYHEIIEWTTQYYYEEAGKVMNILGSTNKA